MRPAALLQAPIASVSVLPLLLMLVCEWLSAVAAAPSPTLHHPRLLYCVHLSHFGARHPWTCTGLSPFLYENHPFGFPSGPPPSLPSGLPFYAVLVQLLVSLPPLPSQPELSSNRSPWVISSFDPSACECLLGLKFRSLPSS